ncbi:MULTISPECIES: lipocalin family protein [Clostridium]|uniref:Lipocalin family protein n=1 Tax=Clostridium frigoriphilum TaxID=443253 RepID=A0ABU7USP9_9CLOT|nr:lipocalin family protein [Clostridium sp. DSM 17811]MBU3100843.1 hypothetical protein [Clostridium sp. DSM 17811]
MEANKKPLLENLKKIGKGIVPFVNPLEDLSRKKDFDTNSWFVIGHFEAEGHKLNFLFHLMTLHMQDNMSILTSVFSITDETTGFYYGEDKVFPLSLAEISETEFSIKAPNGFMSGDLNQMHVQATMPCGKVDVTLNPVGYALYNGSTGYFPMLNMNIHQYSLPTLATTGTITIEDKTYEINGTSWFDRQWQNQSIDIGGHWSWMDINLDNGDKISLWDTVEDSTGNETAWATILHPDGSQTVTAVEPLSIGQSDYWLSQKSGQKYPTHWMVKIPTLDACLEVTPCPKEQEIVSQHEALHKYEGASSVKGTYRGKETTGYCYVELVGSWK